MFENNSRYYLIKNQAQAYISNDKVLPEMTEKLGELVQRRMKEVGISSKAELARRIGKSSAYVGDLINDTAKTKSGTYTPSQEVVASLSKALEISESEILNSIGYISNKEKSYSKLPIAGFDGLDDDDVREMVEFMNFRRAKKGLPPIEPD